MSFPKKKPKQATNSNNNIPSIFIFSAICILAYFAVSNFIHIKCDGNTDYLHIDYAQWRAQNCIPSYQIGMKIMTFDWLLKKMKKIGNEREREKSKFHGSMRFIDITAVCAAAVAMWIHRK